MYSKKIKHYLHQHNFQEFVPRVVLFDMDGVLVNNLDIHRQAFAEFFRRYGVERPFENLSRLFGKGNDDIMGELMPRDIVERVGIRELGNQKEAIYREIYAPTITPQPGLVEFFHLALQKIEIDLDDGVKVNYEKFQNVELVSDNGTKVKKNLLVPIK